MQFFDTDYNFSTIIPSLPKDKHKKILSKEKHKKNSVLLLLVNIFGMTVLFPFEILLRKFFFILLISNLLN